MVNMREFILYLYNVIYLTPNHFMIFQMPGK